MPDTAPPPSLTALEDRLAEAHQEVRALTGEMRSAYQRLERLQCHLRRCISEIERLEARGSARPGSGIDWLPPGFLPAGSNRFHLAGTAYTVAKLPSGDWGAFRAGSLLSSHVAASRACQEARRLADADGHGDTARQSGVAWQPVPDRHDQPTHGEPPAGTVTVVDEHVSPEEARRIARERHRAKAEADDGHAAAPAHGLTRASDTEYRLSDAVRVVRAPSGEWQVGAHDSLMSAHSSLSVALDEARRIVRAEDRGEPPAGMTATAGETAAPEEPLRLEWGKLRTEETAGAISARDLRAVASRTSAADLRPSRPGPK